MTQKFSKLIIFNVIDFLLIALMMSLRSIIISPYRRQVVKREQLKITVVQVYLVHVDSTEIETRDIQARNGGNEFKSLIIQFCKRRNVTDFNRLSHKV
jgi:hypothetical protein